MNLILSILYFTITVSCSSDFFTLEKRFEDAYSSLSSIDLPAIPSQKSIEEELKLYSSHHQQPQFSNFIIDPQLSSQILLKKQNSWSQSLYFLGKEVSNLLLEISVAHESNIHTFDNQSIEMYLINCETKQVLLRERIKTVRLFAQQVVSELYELRIAFNWAANQQSVEPLKHVQINVAIQPILPQQIKNPQDDGLKTNEKMTLIRNETDRIFMNSLEIWDEIQDHHNEHFNNQQKVYTMAYVELIVVILLNIVELLMLRRTLKFPRII